MSDSAIIDGFLQPDADPPSSSHGPQSAATAALRAAEDAYRAYLEAPTNQRAGRLQDYRNAASAAQSAIVHQSAAVVEQLLQPGVW